MARAKGAMGWLRAEAEAGPWRMRARARARARRATATASAPRALAALTQSLCDELSFSTCLRFECRGIKKTKNNNLRGARVRTPCESSRRPSRAARDEFPFEASRTDGRLLALSKWWLRWPHL